MSSEASQAGAPLIRFDGIVKRFGGVTAVRGVTLEIGPGEIVALLGENGAGKSTLIKMLAGIHDPDERRDLLSRRSRYRHGRRNSAQRQPVAFIHQDLGLVDWMTIAENIALAIGYPRKRAADRLARGARRPRSRRSPRSIARSIRRCACATSRARRNRWSRSRARSRSNPTCSCSTNPPPSCPPTRSHRLFDALRLLKGARRRHDLCVASSRRGVRDRRPHRGAARRRAGRRAQRRADDAGGTGLADRRQGARPLRGRAAQRPARPCGSRRAGSRWTAPGRSIFRSRAREIVGLVGLRGAGHERIGRALFGAQAHSGEIRLDGAALALGEPRRRRWRPASGSSRATASTNRPPPACRSARTSSQPRRDRPRRARRCWRRAREGADARALGARVGLRPNEPELPIEALSGGNQQKVVVGRWLAIGGKVLHRRGPDRRRRRRRQGRDLPAARRGAEERALRRRRLDRFRGGRAGSAIARSCSSRGRIVAELRGDEIAIERLIAAASVVDARGLREDAMAFFDQVDRARADPLRTRAG